MMRHKILHTALAASIGSLTIIATAQTIAPVQNDYLHTLAASGSMAAPVAAESDRMKAESSTTAPTNVMDDVPRDMSGKRTQTVCDNDPVTGQKPEGCRRWLEIARTL
jgi:hypothetical protein